MVGPRFKTGRGLVAIALVLGLAGACSDDGGGGGGGDAAPTTTTGTTTAPAGPTTSGAPAPTGDPIVLGSIASDIEGYTTISKDVLNAWVSWVNSHGGINGHPVKVIIRADNNDPAKSVAAAHQLIDQDKVVALINVGGGALIGGWAAYANEKKIPVVGGFTTSLEWTTNPSFYPQGLTFIESAGVPVALSKEAGFKKLGAIFCAEAAQCQQAVEFYRSLAKGAGVDFAYGGNISATAPNYTATCVAARGAQVDVVILGLGTFETGDKLASDCARQGYKPSWIIPGQAMSPKYVASEVFDGAYGYTSNIPWFADVPENKDFRDAVKAAGIDVDNDSNPAYSMDAWGSGLLFQRAVELSGVTGVPTSADILRGLGMMKDETLGGYVGPLDFSDITKKVGRCYFVTKIVDKKLTLPNGIKPTCPPKATP